MSFKLILLAIFPIISWVIWIYLKDKYEKEPLKSLLKFYILGVMSSFLAIFVENILYDDYFYGYFYGYFYKFYVSFIVAGTVEELVKFIFLITFLFMEKNFDEELDGIIYSVFLCLGFATVENIIYLVDETTFFYELGIVRGFISVSAHIMFAINMGYYISKYKFLKRKYYLFLAIFVSILLHGCFDFILMIEGKWSIIFFIGYVMFLWKLNLDKLDEYIKISKKKFNRKEDKFD